MTAEVPITASLPSLNLLRPSVRAGRRIDDIRLLTAFIEFSSLNIDRKAKKMVAALADEYVELSMSDFYGTGLANRSRDMKATAEYLTVLAVMVRPTYIYLA
jgi:hypothetical protein